MRSLFTQISRIPSIAPDDRCDTRYCIFLFSEGVLDTGLAERMLRCRHSGFSVHNWIHSKAADAKGRR
jgi:hypothetical protein